MQYDCITRPGPSIGGMAETVAGAAGPGRFPVAAIREVRARSAPAAACGMFADLTVDFEPSAAGVASRATGSAT